MQTNPERAKITHIEAYMPTFGLWTMVNKVRLLTDGRNYACWCHSRLGPHINGTHKPQNSTDDFSVKLSPCMCSHSSCPGWRNSCNLMANVRPSYRTLPTYMSSSLGPHTSVTALHTHVCMLVFNFACLRSYTHVTCTSCSVGERLLPGTVSAWERPGVKTAQVEACMATCLWYVQIWTMTDNDRLLTDGEIMHGANDWSACK